MLHGAYNLQNWQETEDLHELWKYIATVNNKDVQFQRLGEPILTRWLLVGSCTTSFKSSIQQWRKICSAVCNSAPSGSASYKIASCTVNLINNECIINDLDLLVAYHQSFLDPYFSFSQLGDLRTGKMGGFWYCHIAVWYYLMRKDLERMDKGQ
eukprot:9860134-Ditylum_brightwellii.AAC.1